MDFPDSLSLFLSRSLSLRTYHPSLPAGPLDYILGQVKQTMNDDWC